MTKVIDADDVSAVYSGKQGCACGCRGTHTSKPGSIKSIVAKINQIAADGQHEVHVHDWGAWVDTDTRTYVAYTDGRLA